MPANPIPPAATGFSPDALASALAWVAGVLYLLGLVTLVLRRRRGAPRKGERLDHLPGFVAVAAHAAALLVRGLALGRWPAANLEEALAFLSFLLACSYLVPALRLRSP